MRASPFFDSSRRCLRGVAQKRQIAGGLMKNLRRECAGRGFVRHIRRVYALPCRPGRPITCAGLADVVEPVDTQDLKS